MESSTRKTLLGPVRTLTETVQTLTTRIKRTKAKNQELKDTISLIEAENQQLRETVARTEAKNQQLEETVARTEAKNHQLTETIARTEAKNYQLTETIARTEAKILQLTERVARTEIKNQQLTEGVRHLDNIVEEQAQHITNLQARPVRQPHPTAPQRQVSPDNNEREDHRAKEEEVDETLGLVVGEAQGEDVVMEEDEAYADRHSLLFKDTVVDTTFDLVAHSCNQPASADISAAIAADVADTYPSFPKSFRPIFRRWIRSEADRPSVWALETSHPLWRRRFTAARQTTFSREKKVMRRFLNLVRDADPASPIRTRVRMAVRSVEREIQEAGTLAQFLSTFD